MHKSMNPYGQEVQLWFRPNIKMGETCDLTEIEHGMLLGFKTLSFEYLIKLLIS